MQPKETRSSEAGTLMVAEAEGEGGGLVGVVVRSEVNACEIQSP